MVWDSEMKFVSCCGELPDNFTIKFEPKVYAKIDILMEKKTNIEWLAFLLGDIKWNEEIAVVSDLYIPDSQSVTTGHVDDIECDSTIRNELIGVIHSHHKMGCFFSKDDWEYLNNNHNISIVISNKDGYNEFKSVVRYKTKCGSYTHIDADVIIKCDLDADEMNNFIDDIDVKIKRGMGEFNNNIIVGNGCYLPGIDGYNYIYGDRFEPQSVDNGPVQIIDEDDENFIYYM